MKTRTRALPIAFGFRVANCRLNKGSMRLWSRPGPEGYCAALPDELSRPVQRAVDLDAFDGRG
jgi:hypothetical protein